MDHTEILGNKLETCRLECDVETVTWKVEVS